MFDKNGIVTKRYDIDGSLAKESGLYNSEGEHYYTIDGHFYVRYELV